MLPETLPVYNTAVPPLPVVTKPVDPIVMLPPVEVGCDVFFPAYSLIAVDVVLLVLTLPFSVRSPVVVKISIVPAAFTEPKGIALLFARLTLTPDATDTVPVRLLFALLSVIL